MQFLIGLITTLIFISQVKAGLHLEPLTYYGMGTSTQQNTNSEFKQKGYLFGTRLGFYKNHFMVGLEYLTGEFEYEDKDTNFEYDETPHYMGAYLSYHLKRRIGLNLSYFPKIRSNSDFAKLSGDGWKAELYYRVKTHISLRLGYMHRTLDYDEDINQSISNTFESKTILLGLSFPWVL